jgi:GTPase involved in cell partitioning and DNA repair
MTKAVYELQGYAIMLDKVIFVTRVFTAEDGEGFQFNIRFSGETRLAPKFATRHEADLQRSLIIKALNEI